MQNTHNTLKTFKELKQMDTIDLKVDIFKTKRQEKCMITDILPNYVIKTAYNLEQRMEGTGDAILYAVVEEHGHYISAYMYYRKFYKFMPLFKVKTLDLPTEAGFDLRDYCMYCKEDLDKEGIAHVYVAIIDMMNYISAQLLDVKTVTKKVRQPRAAAAAPADKPAAKPTKKKAVVLNADRVVYEINYREDSTLKQIRSYKRRTESWAVIGHMRQLKSGKKVWVQPYVKGTGEREPKKYIVK